MFICVVLVVLCGLSYFLLRDFLWFFVYRCFMIWAILLVIGAILLVVGLVAFLNFRSLDMQKKKLDESQCWGLGMGFGFGIAMPFGVVYGILLENMALGFGMAPALGAGLGAGISAWLMKRFGVKKELSSAEKKLFRLGAAAGIMVLLAFSVVLLALVFE